MSFGFYYCVLRISKKDGSARVVKGTCSYSETSAEEHMRLLKRGDRKHTYRITAQDGQGGRVLYGLKGCTCSVKQKRKRRKK